MFGENINLDIHAHPRFIRVQGCLLIGVRNNGEACDFILDGRDSEANAVKRNRAFTDDVALQQFRNPNLQPPVVITELVESHDLRSAVYMSQDEMSVEPSASGEGALQVDRRPRSKISQIRSLQSLGSKIGREALIMHLNCRETG